VSTDETPTATPAAGDFAALRGLPFGEQRQRIDAAVRGGERLPELLETLAELRDHEPFAYAVRQLGRAGRLSERPVSRALSRRLRTLPDTGVQRLLRGLDRARLPQGQQAVVTAAVTAAMRHLGLPRLAAFCLMDRWLKNTDPAARQAIGDEARRACQGALSRKGLATLPDEVLLRVPGEKRTDLDRLAEQSGQGPAWQKRRQQLADRVLQVLEGLPKSLSQANAEELLSRQVYTRPGHFLAELLQNAEDAGARRWSVTLDEAAVRVWHDGLDFDARDVVGVLSIGQTTKARGQIGFFGVGFKSVYEICERPQIYSDVFRFEVADVSIPRRLARRPPGAPAEGTLLVLPLRDPRDAERSPDKLWARLAEIPPETLLTLESLETLEGRWGARQRTVGRSPAGPGRVRLSHRGPAEDGPAEDAPARRDAAAPRHTDYLVAHARCRYPGARRDPDRVTETPVRVALRLDAAGRPVPLPAGAPTVYSHLPTAERPGLRFLLHAHFDLPLDRERLDPQTPFNRWALSQVGQVLGQAAARLADEAAAETPDAATPVAETPDAATPATAAPGADGSGRPEPMEAGARLGGARARARLEGLLEVLPLAEELRDPAWRPVLEALGQATAERRLLPAADGGLLRPGRAAVATDPRLARALAGVALDRAGRRLMAPLSPRAAAAARALGARRFDAAALVRLLADTLADHAPGAPATLAAPWVAAGLPELIRVLAATRGERPEADPSAAAPRAPAAAGEGGESELTLAPLRPLAWLPDAAGRLWPAAELARAPEPLRGIYGEARPLLDPALDPGSGALPASAPEAAGLSRLWRRLELPRLGPDALVADLCDPPQAAAILAHAGLDRVLFHLTDEPDARLAPLGAQPLFPDEAGARRPLRPPKPQTGERGAGGPRDAGAEAAPAPAWRAPPGPLGDWLRQMDGAHPPLLDAKLEADHGPLCSRMGAATLELAAVLDALEAGALQPTDEDLCRLHGVLDRLHADLTPRMGTRLARAPLYLTTGGKRRPLRGPDRALVPADPDLEQMAPHAPWLAEPLRHGRHLAPLGAEPVGPDAVARLLAGAPRAGEQGLLDAQAPQALRRAYGYLRRHHAALTARELQALVEAPIWLDTAGGRHPLPRLHRAAAAPALAALYARWPASPVVESAPSASECAPSASEPAPPGSEPAPEEAAPTSALDLARALGLAESLAPLDARQLLADLTRALAGGDAQTGDAQTGDARTGDARTGDASASARPAPPRDLLVDALNEAAPELSGRDLVRLRELPLWQDAAGARRPLGDWEEGARDPERARRACGPLRAALSHGHQPLLHPKDEQRLAPLLEALRLRPADAWDLVAAVQADAGLRHAEAAAAVRQALVSERSALQAALRGTGEAPARRRRRLEELPLWPTTDGRLRPARGVVRAGGLAQALGPDWETLLSAPPEALLRPAAEPEADALERLLRFRAPTDFVIDRLQAEARPGEPAANQPAFLREPEGWSRVLSALRQELEPEALWRLPVQLDAAGRLVTGRLFHATAAEIRLVADEPLGAELALPAWAERATAVDPALAPRLPARRLTAALSQASREPRPLAEAGAARALDWRETLYGWLLSRGDEIAADSQAAGPLGHARLFANQAGELVSPRELITDPRLPAVFRPRMPAEEVPEALRRWLRETYPLGDRALDRLVDHLVSEHDEAVAARDGERSARLLGHLARVLELPEEGEVPSLPRRLKLHRRLRVETDTGRFARPRQLLAADPRHWSLLAAFSEELPERVSDRYRAPRVRMLIRACGARGDLDDEALARRLDSGDALAPGAQAALAFARYLGHRVAERPALRQRLGLDRRAWIPDGEGVRQAPTALYWPDPAVVAVVGDHPGRYPHPEFFHTVPRALADSLPFRQVTNAPLSDVVAEIRGAPAHGPRAAARLAWLEDGLKARRIEPRQVRRALADVAFLADDEGVVRPPGALYRTEVAPVFGSRRGRFGDARAVPRLADALGLRQAPGRKDLRAYLAELTADAERLGPGRLARDEPELLRTLPRCLARLVQLGEPLPARFVLAALDHGAAQGPQATLVLSDDPTLHLAEPPALSEALLAVRAPVRLPLMRQDAAALHTALGRHGVAPLSAAWRPARLPRALPGDISDAAEHAPARKRLAEALEQLDRGPASLALPGGEPDLLLRLRSRSREGAAGPVTVRVVSCLEVPGELAGISLRAALDAVVEHRGRGRRLVVTVEALHDPEAVAAEWVRAEWVEGIAEPELVALVAARLERALRAPADREPPSPVREDAPEQRRGGPGPAGRETTAATDRPPARERPQPDREAAAAPDREAAAAPDREAAAAPDREADAPGEDAPPTRPSREPDSRAAPAREAEPASAEPSAAERSEPARPGPAPSTADRARDEPGLLGRFRRWLRGDEQRSAGADAGGGASGANARVAPESLEAATAGGAASGATAAAAPTGPAPPAHRRWFEPRTDVTAQLGPGAGWLADRDQVPRYGFSHAPGRLPPPYLYGVRVLADRFDPRRQRWQAADQRAQWLQGEAPEAPEAATVTLKGRGPAGQLQLPLPMYAQLESLEPGPHLLDASAGRLLVSQPHAAELGYRVTLGGAPRFDDAAPLAGTPEGAQSLLASTAPEGELPAEALDLVAWLQAERRPALEAAVEIRSFVQRFYRYDPSYLEDSELARWLRRVSRGRANIHLAALHAGRDARHLGAGVCYELNVLVCELLRRTGIPAAVATGWTFDRGQAAEPDHLWALALLPSDLGPRWLPVDASTTREGRPLHAGDRPAGPWRPRGAGRRQRVPPTPAWAQTQRRRGRPPALPLGDLLRVARHVEQLSGVGASSEAELREQCHRLLAEPEQARALLRLLRSPDAESE
jgi:hypothetical protein